MDPHISQPSKWDISKLRKFKLTAIFISAVNTKHIIKQSYRAKIYRRKKRSCILIIDIFATCSNTGFIYNSFQSDFSNHRYIILVRLKTFKFSGMATLCTVSITGRCSVLIGGRNWIASLRLHLQLLRRIQSSIITVTHTVQCTLQLYLNS